MEREGCNYGKIDKDLGVFRRGKRRGLQPQPFPDLPSLPC